MIKKLLIANRGEIACRVISTAKKRGIKTVAVFSDADRNALHVAMADEAVYIGEAPAKDSYLRAEHIIDVAKTHGVDAIHPGYGFLSENAAFANACEANHIIFVGPPASAIEAMGSKSAAKHIMENAGVPLVPGYHGDDQSTAILKKAADDMGYPVLLKAAAGGGGKGMRQVWNEADFQNALDAAKRESLSSFGDDHMLVEKYLTKPRHVEIQVFCDKHGNGVYLFERDCSVQRRHQKIIEEAPAPGMTQAIRSQMGEAAIKAAKAIDYVGAGTVEFLLDEDGSFYFMEMNTRLQVEHPVTEMITGEDLVEWQLKVAQGETLPKTQDQLEIRGHAFEARIYAEDPYNDFLPVTGTLNTLSPPQSTELVRVDTGVLEGDEVSIYYDPMIAKLIVWGDDRELALQRLGQALEQYHIDGVTTNIDFLAYLTRFEPFQRAELTTTFVDKHIDALMASKPSYHQDDLPLMAMLVLLRNQAQNNAASAPWQSAIGWRSNLRYSAHIEFAIDDELLEAECTITDASAPLSPHWSIKIGEYSWLVEGQLVGNELHITVNDVLQKIRFAERKSEASERNSHYVIFTPRGTLAFEHVLPDLGDSNNVDSDASLTAPMNGTIVTHLCNQGDVVTKGTPILVMEAMKMEHTINAPSDGTVAEFYYQPGELVDGGATLLDFIADTENKRGES